MRRSRQYLRQSSRRVDRAARRQGIEITAAQSDGQPGLADSAISIAYTIHSEILGLPLQYRAPAHGVGSQCSRSATGNEDQSPLNITPSLVRRGCRARQHRAGWLTPRVFLGATPDFTGYLRMTTGGPREEPCLHQSIASSKLLDLAQRRVATTRDWP